MNIDTGFMDDDSSTRCNGCGQCIFDHDLMIIKDFRYHSKCLVCQICGQTPEGRCFSSYGSLYCFNDFMKIHGIHCFVCGELVVPNEMIYKIGPNETIHARCFCCSTCSCPIGHGENFNKNALTGITCQNCQITSNSHRQQQYQQLPPPPPPLPESNSQPINAQSYCNLHPMHRKKRARTVLTAQQRHLFRRTFEETPKPSRRLREQLAMETGLTSRVIQVWFQNERAKMKRDRAVHA